LSSNSPPTYRRIWPERPRFFEPLPATPPDQAAEVLAHVVIALSRYLRHLRLKGRCVPAQLEEFTAFLATHVTPRQVMPSLDGSSAGSDSSAVSRRLLITKREAAEQLGVSLRTIERLISAGRLPLVHVEGAARVRVADLEAYVQGLDADDRTAPSSAEDAR
jgi:excisionase family DNA binding protein